MTLLLGPQHLPLIKRSIIPDALFPKDLTGPQPDILFDLPDNANVQGDIYMMFPKGAESFIFFTMTDAAKFRTFLQNYTPTSAADTVDNLVNIYDQRFKGLASRLKPVPTVQTQIAFSRAGLNFLGVTDNIQDAHFDKGSMLLDKKLLDDQREWNPIFASGSVHGVLMITGDTPETCDDKTQELQDQLAAQDVQFDTIIGRVRPDDNKGHEHFGFLDGISQPALRGIITPKPGQLKADPGVIVMGYKGDPVLDNPDAVQRPDWTKDGSLMVFRQLEQDVPEFLKYAQDNGQKWRLFLPADSGPVELTDEEGTALFKAQVMARWTSGAPLALTPVYDDPDLGSDPNRRNNFNYVVKGVENPSSLHCPFTAHARKVAPRNLDPYVQRKFLESVSIIRTGIPYGDELTDTEKQTRKTGDEKRGLLFVCYQSSLPNGFIRLTTAFANNDYFPPTSFVPEPHGQDPILGSPPHIVPLSFNIQGAAGRGAINVVGQGVIPPTPSVIGIEQEFFVTSRGGEYSFVPSLSTLDDWSNAD